MKAIKYLFMSALLMGFSTAAKAQDGTAADIAAVKQLIQSHPANMAKAMKPFYSKNKKNPENLLAFGRAFFEAQDTANARIAANNALTASKRQYAPAYVLLGDICALGDDGGGAAQNYEMAIHFDPKQPEAYRKYASVYRKIDPEGAVAKLEELRQQRPDYPVDALIGHINYLSLRYGSAIEAYERVPLSQMQKMDFIEYSFSNYFAKRYEKALEVAEAGLQKEPGNATLTRLAMFGSTETGKFQEAIRYADIMFNQLNKDSVNLSEMDYLNYGKALAGNNQFEEAIQRYEEGMKLAANDENAQADFYMAISDAYKGLENYPKAIETFRKYLDIGKDAKAQDYANLGILAVRYAGSLAIDESNTTLTDEEKATQKQAQIDAYKAADEIFADLIKKYPDAEEFGLLQRGGLNSKLDDSNQSQGLAKPFYERLIKLITARTERDDTDNNRLYVCYSYMMNYNYRVTKDRAAALEFAQKMLEIKPDDEDVKRVIEVLSKRR